MNLKDFKSPHGIPKHFMSCNNDIFLKVKVRWRKEFRYFYADNWTHFEKDLAKEITAKEFQAQHVMFWAAINAIRAERGQNAIHP